MDNTEFTNYVNFRSGQLVRPPVRPCRPLLPPLLPYA